MIGINTLRDNSEVAVRGTCGFYANADDRDSRGIVEHVFADGRLLIHDDANSDSHVIIPRSQFKPSRNAYFTFASGIEPRWDGDTCRCTNWWATPEFGDPRPNQAANIHTDDEVLRIHGFDRLDFATQ